MAHELNRDQRPCWPRRAIVTAGMPYGNKGLHFGHVGGVFVPADFYARFLRDRLGRENVIFVSGTDCYGSPIMEGFRKRREADGYSKHISDYVRENHDSQESDLASFGVSCDLYAGSALEPAVHIHERVTDEIVERLYEQGKLTKLSTKQFYDAKAGQFLNGRQVLGRCPIQGCKSEKAYADECDLGHQFEPEELIAPKSALTGETPELVPVDNLYFDLPAYTEYMREHTERLATDPTVRSVVSKTMQEWLDAPRLFIQTKFRDEFEAIRGELPSHAVFEAEGNKGSFTVVFPTWRERDDAHEVLNRAGVRFRSGKALVPFRISGNVEWGVPLPEIDGCRDLTAWVWPESLWAPISFSRTVLARDAAKLQAAGVDASELAPDAVSDAQLMGDVPAMIMDEPDYTHSSLDWRDWWANEDARAYQFIGQDNIYFYCIAQSGMWEALDWNMQQSCVAANYHILYMGKKASSSSQTPPPLAHEMLEHYTPEQLRAHWLSLGLGEKPVSFSPKAFDTRETGKDSQGNPILARDDKRVIDPALKEGALLTGVFNRLARSCFYGVAEKDGDEAAYRTGCIPAGEPDADVLAETEKAILAFERAMYTFELHHALGVCDEFLRSANKRWSDASKAAKNNGDDAAMAKALANAFHQLRAATVLMHGIVPTGCELIQDYFDIDPQTFFSWSNIFKTCDELCGLLDEEPGSHRVKALPPRFDFFQKHESQF